MALSMCPSAARPSDLLLALFRIQARLRTNEFHHLGRCQEKALEKANEYSQPPSSTPSWWLTCHSGHTHSHEGSGTWAVCILVGDVLWYVLAAVAARQHTAEGRERGAGGIRRRRHTPGRGVQSAERLGGEEGDAAEEAAALVFVENVNGRLALLARHLGRDAMAAVACQVWRRSCGRVSPSGVPGGLQGRRGHT